MHDLAIIGAGPAGLTASIYASRYKINHLIFGLELGGQGALAPLVENFPGYLSTSGLDLMQKIIEQVKSYGVEIRQEKVTGLAKITDGFKLTTDKGKYQAKTLILAMGAAFRRLGIPGEKIFLGKGVSYCATCDAPLFRNKTVAVVGGGDCAITEALHLTAFAQKVYLIHRRSEFRAEPAWIEKLKKEPKIEKILENYIKEIRGKERVKEISLENSYQGKTNLAVDGVFIEIGHVPSSVLAQQIGVKLDENGYVTITPAMETNIAGCFAAGDLVAMTGRPLIRQLITSAADGARAASAVYDYLHKSTPAPSWGK